MKYELILRDEFGGAISVCAFDSVHEVPVEVREKVQLRSSELSNQRGSDVPLESDREATDRGFPWPQTPPEVHRHRRERFSIVRLTQYEKDLLEGGAVGVGIGMRLLAHGDGTYDGVRAYD
jgi:hypothetical protein